MEWKRNIETSKNVKGNLEIKPEISGFLNDLINFLIDNKREINERIHSTPGLLEYLYREFITIGYDNSNQESQKKNLIGKQLIQRLAQKLSENYKNKKYQKLLKTTSEKFKKMELEVLFDNSWFYCNINGGPSLNKKLGRFYLNLKSDPEIIINFFERAIKSFQTSGLHVQIKIPRHGSDYNLKRRDKMVIYFNEDETLGVINILKSLYNNNEMLFNAERLYFTAPIKDSSGKEMRGIGFGEEPSSGKESFSEVRTKILVRIIQRYISIKKINLITPKELYQYFVRACKEFGVDPENPAFNSGPENTFKKIILQN